MKVVAYCRVSTNQEDQKNSLENQKEHYMKLFKEHKYDVADCGLLYKKDGTKELIQGLYADEGISGSKSYKYREAFKQMLVDAKKGYFDRIYIKNVTRFARNVEDGAKILKDLKEYNVEVYFEDGGLSSLNPSNELVINMLISTAQEESRLKSSAVQFGIRLAQKKGKWTGGVHPFGYDLVDGYLQINEQEADIVKMIYKMYLEEGAGFQKIARYLNSEKIPTKLGKKWSVKQVNTILKNPLYNGTQRTHMEVVADVNRQYKKAVPKEEWIVHEKEELKIIDDETFKLTQEELQKRHEMWKEQKRRPSNVHLLSNILICDNCRTGLRRKKRKAYVRKDGTSKDLGYEWACTMNDRYGANRCEFRNALPEEYIIERIQSEITKLKQDKSILNDMYKEYLDLYYNTDTTKEIEELETDINKLQKRSKMNLELLTDEIISKEQYKEQNDELQEELKQKESRLNRLRYIDKEITETNFKYKQYIKYINDVDTDNLSNVILKKLIKYIEVYTYWNEDEEGNKVGDRIVDMNIIWNFLNTSIDNIALDSALKEI